MNNIKLSILISMVVLFFASCADENEKPIITFDDAGKGAYPRLISETDKLINLFDVGGSSYNYSIEFVDLEQGALVSSYDLQVTYQDNDPSNGDKSSGPNALRSYSSSDFETNGDGFKGLSNITITANELIAAAGITEDDLSAGDNFVVTGSVTTTDGQTFTAANSSASVKSSSFRGHFDMTFPAACPSSIEGTYAYESTDAWCDGSATSGTVDVVAEGGGVYHFSDWSFGAYGPCYGAVAAQDNIEFTDVCNEVAFTAVVDSYGDTWTFVSSVDGESWSIEWSNTYNESGKTVLTKPGGWGFTLK